MVVLSADEPWWGAEEIDAAWPASHEEMVEAGSTRRLEVVRGVGHDVPSDRPQAVVEAIVRILETTGATDP